jgi:hypothetical protein
MMIGPCDSTSPLPRTYTAADAITNLHQSAVCCTGQRQCRGDVLEYYAEALQHSSLEVQEAVPEHQQPLPVACNRELLRSEFGVETLELVVSASTLLFCSVTSIRDEHRSWSRTGTIHAPAHHDTDEKKQSHQG